MPGRWWRRAECHIRKLDPRLFFPDVGQPIDPAVFSACSACQVRRLCLRDAMANEPDFNGRRYGIWGGLAAKQRTMLAAGKPVKFLIPTAMRNKQRQRWDAGRAAVEHATAGERR